MKVLILLEFGIPPYRDFLFRFINEQEGISDFLVVHTGQKFEEWDYSYPVKRVKTVDFRHLSIHRGILPLIDQYDVVISSFNIYRPLCWLPMLWKKKPWILWGPGLGRNRLDRLNRIIRLPFIRRASKFIVYTHSAKEELVVNWGIEEEKIAVANNTLYVSNAGFSEEPRNYLLYVGRIQPRKGILKVLEAIRHLRAESGLDVPFVIVGDGDHKTELEEYVARNNISDLVQFQPGTFDDSTLKEYFARALCYVSPDHVGLGVVHSFSYGVPVVTSTEKDHAREFSYCSHLNSFLYGADSELPEIIRKIVRNPELSAEKGRVGYRYYKEHLDYRHMNKVFLDSLKNCLPSP